LVVAEVVDVDEKEVISMMRVGRVIMVARPGGRLEGRGLEGGGVRVRE